MINDTIWFFEMVDEKTPIEVYVPAKNNNPINEPKVVPNLIFPTGFPNL